MTFGKLKEWLNGLSPGQGLDLPDGLPDELGDLKNAVNIEALADWFAVGSGLTEIEADAGNLCLSGTVAPGTPTISLWFFTAADSEPVADDVEILGVRIAVSLASHPVLSVLSGIGIRDVVLVYEIRMLEGAAVRRLYAQAELPVKDGESLLITCALEFDAGQKSFEFLLEPESGKGWRIAEAVFGLFGVAPPLVLKDMFPERLMVAYDTGTGTSGFRVAADVRFPLGDADADLALRAQLVRRADNDYEKEVSGALRVQVPDDLGDVRVLAFDVMYEELPGTNVVTASWAADAGLPLTDLVAALGVDMPDLPEALRPELHALSMRYDSATRQVLLTAETERTGWVYASRPGAGPGSPRRTAAAVRVQLGARASDLPLVGEAIPPGADLVLDGIAFTLAPTGWTADQAAALNSVLDHVDPAADRRLPRFAADTTAGPGVAVLIELSIAGVPQAPLVLPVTTGTGGALVAASRGPVAVRAADESGARALDLTFGAVRISRIGVGLANGQIFVAFDATLAVGPVELDLIGLGLGIDANLDVRPRLQGAGIRLDKPPLKLSGALESREQAGFSTYLTGLVVVETGFFALRAAASYARSVDGWSSVFLFGEVAAQGGQGLFGPPAFQVTAISLGFGVNSTVRTPSIDNVGQFPLVQRLAGGEDQSLEEVLEKLAGPGGWITPRKDQYWGAGGVEFTSFKFLEARALLLVEGGQRWQVMLIGRATVALPRSRAAKQPIARVVVDLAIAYQEERHLFSMDAVVAPGSYILDPAAELSGGLSLHIWSKDTTASGGGKGFVFTLGGYHPKFKIPAYYPKVPRVGWKWSRGDVVIRSEMYAAVTDGAFMAGGALDARYDRGHGIRLEAWFTAHADVLVQWKPFYFELSAGMSIGVAATVKVLFVRVRVSLSVGVSLDLWGPPIGGRVKVKVWFISFTIGIGGGRDSTMPAVEWDEFRMQVPAPLRVVPLHGLLADVAPSEVVAREENGDPLLISADGFAVTTEAAIPASKITLNDKGLAGGDSGTVNIRPMRRTGVRSHHRVRLHRYDTLFDDYEKEGWKVELVRQGLPKALWGTPLTSASEALHEDGVLDGCLAGVRFVVPPPKLTEGLGPVTSQALDVDGQPPSGIPLRDPAAAGPEPVEDDDSIAKITHRGTGIGSDACHAERTGVHTALAALGFAPGANGTLSGYAERASSTFTDPPLATAAP
ncbi:hypothetical protein RM550_01550 [Streptomyces sp. DSM 41527]|uniref:DUF6603 domain-containing protein n=1 Tax=Streptomyces mooreae TaxID=3075523 RepID=A0ABU2T2I4_9ACTN|nr:DUF6603 domain-containing protein [Streptomyces sp. DSM 41527]MDT0454424.1 hypothetical protein [Streptomyces sp. DSM 41527]